MPSGRRWQHRRAGRYRQGVLEPQLYPDTPNRPNFGSARLVPGQTYGNEILYTFSTVGDRGSAGIAP